MTTPEPSHYESADRISTELERATIIAFELERVLGDVVKLVDADPAGRMQGAQTRAAFGASVLIRTAVLNERRTWAELRTFRQRIAERLNEDLTF